MSLSDASESRAPETPPPEQERWGTVFMGPDAARESRMDKLLNQHERELWNRSTENEYLRRVREKAAAEARAILDKARADGDGLRREANAWAMELKARTEEAYASASREQAGAEASRCEADRIRAQARDEGWQAGFAAARQECLEHEARRDAAAGAVLRRIREQCGVLFAAWREELAALTRQAVQTGAGWVMSEERALGLEQLLAQSVQALESRQPFTLRVNPEDADLARDMLGRAQDSLGLERWTVLADADMEAGGLRLESDAGQVEDYPSLRRAVVEEALSRLALPPDCDQAACEAACGPLPELDCLPEPAAPDPEDVPDPQDAPAAEIRTVEIQAGEPAVQEAAATDQPDGVDDFGGLAAGAEDTAPPAAD